MRTVVHWVEGPRSWSSDAEQSVLRRLIGCFWFVSQSWATRAPLTHSDPHFFIGCHIFSHSWTGHSVSSGKEGGP